MPRITDQDYMTACANGDGTYSLVKAAQWLVEAVSGKPLSAEDANALVEKGRQRARARAEVKNG